MGSSSATQVGAGSGKIKMHPGQAVVTGHRDRDRDDLCRAKLAIARNARARFVTVTGAKLGSDETKPDESGRLVWLR